MTVVPESAGTTTVVLLFCGAGGLLLLMHPDNAASTKSEANIAFMLNPLTSLKQCGASMMLSAVHWIRPRPLPTVGDLLQLGKKPGFCRLITRCMRPCFTARWLLHAARLSSIGLKPMNTER
jgi:hypothetical protein